jgi:peroxiredoxin
MTTIFRCVVDTSVCRNETQHFQALLGLLKPQPNIQLSLTEPYWNLPFADFAN